LTGHQFALRLTAEPETEAEPDSDQLSPRSIY
jgi:hypothetical protein